MNASSVAYKLALKRSIAEARVRGQSQGSTDGRTAGVKQGTHDGRLAGKAFLAKLQVAQAVSTSSTSGSSPCPAGEVVSTAVNNGGQCVRTGYTTSPGYTTHGPVQVPTFVDPNGTECAASLVQNGYCLTP